MQYDEPYPKRVATWATVGGITGLVATAAAFFILVNEWISPVSVSVKSLSSEPRDGTKAK